MNLFPIYGAKVECAWLESKLQAGIVVTTVTDRDETQGARDVLNSPGVKEAG